MEKRLITIFIHGTLPPRAFLKIQLLKNFFWCPPGLSLLTTAPKPFHLASLGEWLCTEDPELFKRDSFYLFGWSGRLRVSERRKAAQELVYSLKKHIKEDPSFSLRIIAHSHGGNVALHLAEFSDELPVKIEELILLACPVQRETEPFIAHPLFPSILSVHSHLDVVQLIDPQGIHNFLKSIETKGLEATVLHLNKVGPLFSARHFKAAPNLKQIHVKYASRELFHIEFILADYIRSFPRFLRAVPTLTQTEKDTEYLYIIPS